MKKKILSMILAGVMVMSMAACAVKKPGAEDLSLIHISWKILMKKIPTKAPMTIIPSIAMLMTCLLYTSRCV